MLGALVAGCHRDPTTDTAGSCSPVAGEPQLDARGGDGRVELEATGWFRLEESCGRWWFVTPEGHPFWSAGVNDLHPRGDRDPATGERVYAQTVADDYASEEAWADAAVERMRSWGLNTAGSWSDDDLASGRLAYVMNLHLSGADWLSGEVADYFDPTWEQSVAERVATHTRPEDDDLLGYFLDNEIPWGPDWRGQDTLLQVYLALPPTAPGKAVAVEVLLDGLGGLDEVNAFLGTELATVDDLLAATTKWGALDPRSSEVEAALTTAFLERAAAAYFATTTAAIRHHDDHHLILGNREVSVTTRAEVYQAAAPHVDALSINNYVFVDGVSEGAIAISGSLDPADGFAALHQLVDLPVLITEFGFRAADAGLANSWPPIYPTLADQEARADAFATYSRGAQAIPWIVGHHWYKWVDNPVNGRFDGEDNNWGLVDEQDQVYEVLTQRMAEVHAEVWGRLEVE